MCIHPKQWKIFPSDFNLKRDVKDSNWTLYVAVASQASGGLQFRTDDSCFCFICIANEILWYFWFLSTFSSEMVDYLCCTDIDYSLLMFRGDIDVLTTEMQG